MKQTVMITGADHGLGLALVEAFLNTGAVVIAGRYIEESTALSNLKRIHENNLQIVPLDVSSPQSIKDAALLFEKQFGHLDILINNAAVLGDIEKTIFEDIDYEDILRTFEVNTLGPLRMTNHFLTYLLQGETRLIVNISSEAGSIATCNRKNWFGYTMSKSALNMQSALLQNQLSEQGVQVLLFHPGWLRTYMSGKLDQKAPTLPVEAAERLLHHIKQARNYQSDKPAYIDNDTGEMLPW